VAACEDKTDPRGGSPRLQEAEGRAAPTRRGSRWTHAQRKGDYDRHELEHWKGPVRSSKNKPELYYGRQVSFRGAEKVAKVYKGKSVGIFELARFAPFRWKGAEMATDEGKWETLGASDYAREDINEFENGHAVGPVLAHPTILNNAGETFTESWGGCNGRKEEPGGAT
jgi:hypothetical protein